MAEISEPTLGLPLKEDTEKEKDTLSWSSIGCHAWQRLKLNFNSVKTMETEKKSPKKHRQWGVTFVRGMSAFQLFLGFCCIVIALVGLAAVFKTKQMITREVNSDLQGEIKEFYRGLVNNVTKTAKNDRIALMDYYRNAMRKMQQSNATNDYPSFTDQPQPSLAQKFYDRWNEAPASVDYYRNGMQKGQRAHATNEYPSYSYPPQPQLPQKEYGRWDFPDYCRKREPPCYAYGIDKREKEARLIMDYLCVPAWTGIMYIITGLVGLRMMASKKPMEYSQVSHSYTLLNFLSAALFAPGMLAVGILQWHFSDHYWYYSFRIVVGQVTIGFAGVGLLLSLILCIVGCCCPISPRLHDNHYKELSESTETLPEEKQQEEDKDKIIVA